MEKKSWLSEDARNALGWVIGMVLAVVMAVCIMLYIAGLVVGGPMSSWLLAMGGSAVMGIICGCSEKWDFGGCFVFSVTIAILSAVFMGFKIIGHEHVGLLSGIAMGAYCGFTIGGVFLGLCGLVLMEKDYSRLKARAEAESAAVPEEASKQE